MKKIAIVLLLASGLTVVAKAEEEVLVTFKMMAPETALTVAQTALRNCRDSGYQVAVAVVDRFGNLQVLLRDRFAGVHTIETARRKAWTAVSFRTDTTVMAEQTQSGKEASGVRFVDQAMMVGGGIVIQGAGSVVGGVGVSGAPGGAADDECARVGVAAVQEDLDF